MKIDSQLKTLEEWFVLTANQAEDEVKAHLSRYLCIRTAGVMESALKQIFQSYVDGKCPKSIATYTNKQIGKINNVESDKIATLLGLFSDDWKEKYNSFVEGKREASLNSLVGQRHTLAHNFNNNSISYSQVKEYYMDIKEIINFLRGVIK